MAKIGARKIRCIKSMEDNSLEIMQEGFKKMGIAMKDLASAISQAMTGLVNNVWNSIKPALSFLDKNISRKRFIKLLMSRGFQRNEATKIAWEVHKEKGKYTLLDYFSRIDNKEE